MIADTFDGNATCRARVLTHDWKSRVRKEIGLCVLMCIFEPHLFVFRAVKKNHPESLWPSYLVFLTVD
jgi:hypothetical protein